MAGLFWNRDEEWCEAWDYRFRWTDEHLTADKLRPLIYTYDELGAKALDRLDEICPPSKAPPATGEKSDSAPGQTPHRDLHALLRDNAKSDQTIGELWEQINTVPDWVDWAQVERGQKVFLRYAGPAIFALTFQSLVGGMGSRRVVETLARTGGFGFNVTRRRLLETFQHILQVTRDLASVQPSGDGFASSVRVRLLHASVRRRILALAATQPSYYDVTAWGVPVNDLDSIGTISTFSATLLWIGLPRQGIFLTEAEKADYIALWRWVAHILGTPTDPFASASRARAFMESLLLSEIEPSDTSRQLANNVLTGLANQPPSHVSREFLAAETYWLNGPKLARALAVERPPFYYFPLIVGHCIFFMAMCYFRRLSPSWDESRNKVPLSLASTSSALSSILLGTNKEFRTGHKPPADHTFPQNIQKALFNFTVHKTELGALGKETNFEFKYIPTLDIMSTAAAASEPAPSAPPPRAKVATRRVRITERRSLVVLVLAVAVAGVLSWIGVKITSAILVRIVHLVSR
ncbi:hypothetical protein CCHL11_01429 [Colletotrichum chlorophyti]|uniref:ER-bound oxygenase mpaB/mpaB'/Rubber oxygenase catalytic domain-containing protein n=1 Tax=Colletotrichum chlorophyti TaxID=708187 RepID=A0A1Q8RXY8_9PEZI|nr:hypothetical protein CCHL11_01429 [Colletotrichum chlorophyti]